MTANVESQIITLIEQWRELTSRPVDKDWVHANLYSDEQSMQQVTDFIKGNFIDA